MLHCGVLLVSTSSERLTYCEAGIKQLFKHSSYFLTFMTEMKQSNHCCQTRCLNLEGNIYFSNLKN